MGLFLSSVYIDVTLKCCTWRKNGNTQHFHDVPVVPLIKPIHHTFVQLVLIKRMMFNHNIKSGKKTSKTSSELDQTVKYYMCNVVNKTEYQRYRWLLQLLSKCSLKQYFDLFYTDSHCTPIDFTFYMVIRSKELEESCICEWLLPDMNDMRTIKQLIEKDCINPFLSIFSSGTNKDYSIPKGNKYCCLLKKPEIEIGYRKPCKVNKSEKYLPTLFYCCVRNAVCNNCNCQPIY